MFSDPQRNIEFLNLQPGMNVADLGAGSGFYTFEASRRVGRGKVYAVEVQKDLLAKLKNEAVHQHLNNIEIVWGDIEKIGGTKLRDNSVDRVIASNVLFQVEHQNEFSLEVKRILRPGGKVMIIDWTTGSSLGPKTVVSQTLVQSLFEKAGFVYETTFNAGDHHYGLILTKKP